MTTKNLTSDRINRIKPSPSVAANALVNELRAAGHDIINFTIGEPDFDTPTHIIEAATQDMHSGDTHYTPSNGTRALREAITIKLKRDNGLDYSIQEVVCGNGGKHIISSAFGATLNAGNEVIIHAPYWVSYPDLALLNEAVPVIIAGKEELGFKVSPEEIRQAVTNRTKWVILNYPNNPSGVVYNAAELNEIAAVLRDFPDVLIMLDEIYEHFVYEKSVHISLAEVAPDLKDRILIINGALKGYAMTGWRLGYGVGPEWLISAMTKLISQTATCSSSVSQAGAVVAFAGDQRPVKEMCAVYETRRRAICDHLCEVEDISFIPPSGAFYLYINVSKLLNKKTHNGHILHNDDDVVEYLLREGGVATVSGKAYGMSPYIRVSFASSLPVIEEGCIRFKTLLAA
ncbi:pyridoxal phosphate-dependent aminotransferase (plasmid) [Pantoea sp. C3]|uniref:pyridoxal phosphate-dependent aminotransferase n=1 Tax=Pantoea phytostimulans TaxID=2769024 RepID=UPI0038F7F607